MAKLPRTVPVHSNMSRTLRLSLLGTGSSGGVPRIDGDWGACDSAEPRNRRTRCSLLAQLWSGEPGDPDAATTVLIDTSPDLREQALAVGLRRLDAVLYSHDHADQSHGIDDLRAFALSTRTRIPVWMDGATRTTLTQRFSYCFQGGRGYPPILEDCGVLRPGIVMGVDGPGGRLEALPLDQEHGTVRSLGFRFGPVAYTNDVRDFPEASLQALEGLEVWVADALRFTPHPSHAHLDRVLEWRDRLRPRLTVLTNLHIDMDYRSLLQSLPEGVIPGYDGLAFDVRLGTLA